MARSRRLRRLVPDDSLFDRRAAGESLRPLAHDYGVTHTTLARYFGRPEAVFELREARRRLQVTRKVLAAQRARERRLEQDVRERARENAKHDRELEAWIAPSRRDGYEAWLDLHDAPQKLHSRELYSANDRLAEKVVAEGGGVDEVIKGTGLRSRENVYRLDAQIMRRALQNDARRVSAARLDVSGLRRLVPDSRLIRRRAEGETLRELADDYDVSHTILSRYFKRAEVAKQLRAQPRRRSSRRESETTPTPERGRRVPASGLVAEFRTEIRRIRCPVHGEKLSVRTEAGPDGAVRLAVPFCCPKAKKELESTLSTLTERTGAAVDVE